MGNEAARKFGFIARARHRATLQFRIAERGRSSTFKVVPRTMIEIYLVASIQTQADRTQKPSTPSPGKIAGRVLPSVTPPSPNKACGTFLIAGAEVNKSHFDRCKSAQRTRTRHKFGTKEGM